MGLTVTQAVNYVRQKIDDVDAANFEDDDIREAIDGAMDYRLKEYVEHGAQFLHEQLDTASTAGGVVDLSAVDPFQIQHVSLVDGGRHERIDHISTGTRANYFKDSRVRNVQIQLVRGFTRSVTASDPLILGATARNAVSFERLVLLSAAEELLINDGVSLKSLERVMGRYEKAAYRFTGVTGATGTASRSVPSVRAKQFGWTYDPATEALQLWRRS